MRRIGLMSATHGFLDEAVLGYFAECDEVWHAGDFGTLALLEQLEAFKPTRGVFGNVDGAELRRAAPRDLEWECEGVRVYMTHIGGYPGAYEKRVKPELAARRPGLFICGRSHILKVMRDEKLGLIHLNPGACGHHGWHTMRTLLRFSVDNGMLQGLEAIELGPRGVHKT
ncbi:MAG: metallophosphoesterase family protein [Acidobacteria bacterium]|nr:metallophosphoesterase family protein [Acidobacteriota bacterium]